MDVKNKALATILGVGLLYATGIEALASEPLHPGSLEAQVQEVQDKKDKKEQDKYDALAKHLKEIGAKMYGTTTCSWCKKQKEEFGGALEKYKIYKEADTDKKIMQEAKELGIKGWPTWVFKTKEKPGYRLVPGYHPYDHIVMMSKFKAK